MKIWFQIERKAGQRTTDARPEQATRGERWRCIGEFDYILPPRILVFLPDDIVVFSALPITVHGGLTLETANL